MILNCTSKYTSLFTHARFYTQIRFHWKISCARANCSSTCIHFKHALHSKVSCWNGADKLHLLEPLIRSIGPPTNLSSAAAKMYPEPDSTAKQVQSDWVYLAQPLPMPYGTSFLSYFLVYQVLYFLPSPSVLLLLSRLDIECFHCSVFFYLPLYLSLSTNLHKQHRYHLGSLLHFISSHRH